MILEGEQKSYELPRQEMMKRIDNDSGIRIYLRHILGVSNRSYHGLGGEGRREGKYSLQTSSLSSFLSSFPSSFLFSFFHSLSSSSSVFFFLFLNLIYPLLSWNQTQLCRPGYPLTHRDAACHFLWSSGIKGVPQHQPAGFQTS